MKLQVNACRCGHGRHEHRPGYCTVLACDCLRFHKPSPQQIARLMAGRLMSEKTPVREKRIILRHIIDVLAKDFRGKAKAPQLPRE